MDTRFSAPAMSCAVASGTKKRAPFPCTTMPETRKVWFISVTVPPALSLRALRGEIVGYGVIGLREGPAGEKCESRAEPLKLA